MGDNLNDSGSIDFESLQVCYEFKGAFTHEKLKEIGDLINEKLFPDFNPKVRKRIFACSNEMVQNVGFYSMERTAFNEGTIGVGSIKILINDELVILETENKIESSTGIRLTGKIDVLNRMGEDELKKVYLEKIRGETEEGSKGAGIGFIEIIKRTKNPVRTELQLIDNEYSLIKIRSIIRKEKENG